MCMHCLCYTGPDQTLTCMAQGALGSAAKGAITVDTMLLVQRLDLNTHTTWCKVVWGR
jgi:hypothetical protein